MFLPPRNVSGHGLIDFATTVSPFGPSKAVCGAVQAAAAHLDEPADASCSELCRQIAESEGVDASYVYCGADTADLAQRLITAIAPKKALLPAPSYGIYDTLLENAGCAVSRCMLWETKGFSLTDGFLDALKPEHDIVFLCQPNNPTGLMVPQQLLLSIIEQCAQSGIYLVLDECFLDFLENPMLSSEKPLLKRYPNLILLKSPSVTHGMAGLKLAYCITSNRQLTAQLRRSPMPCTISSLTQTAGIVAVQDEDYVRQARLVFARERARIIPLLQNAGATVYPGTANFLLFRTPVAELSSLLLMQGFLVHDCSDCTGLSAGYCRLSLRSPVENTSLAGQIRDILKKNGVSTPRNPLPVPDADEIE